MVMADLLDKKTAAETRAPTAPDKQRLDLRPKLHKPPAPKIYRWIQWMALFVVAAVAAVLAALLLTGGDEGLTAAPFDPGTEHGGYTALAVRDLTNVDLPRFVGSDAYLDPDYPSPEHGAFTTLAIRDITNAELPRFVGRDAALD
jgi:hypothetical protein